VRNKSYQHNRPSSRKLLQKFHRDILPRRTIGIGPLIWRQGVSYMDASSSNSAKSSKSFAIKVCVCYNACITGCSGDEALKPLRMRLKYAYGAQNAPFLIFGRKTPEPLCGQEGCEYIE